MLKVQTVSVFPMWKFNSAKKHSPTVEFDYLYF